MCLVIAVPQRERAEEVLGAPEDRDARREGEAVRSHLGLDVITGEEGLCWKSGGHVVEWYMGIEKSDMLARHLELESMAAPLG